MSSSLDRLAHRAIANSGNPLLGGREIDIPLAKIRFDPSQPRKAFHHLDGRVAQKDVVYIEELAATIKERGLIQAITVQEMDDGSFLVVVGECRTRAHLLLKSPTIRAVVRNDLSNQGQRLLYQIAENVNRQDLTDDELAGSVRALIEGGGGLEPMSQVQIARTLGKAAGWVSRLVRFSEEEQQRLWVRPGVVDTIENVYRVSILPKAMQIEILRRVSLRKGDRERLAIPLQRKFIDELTREAKINKKAGKLIASRSSNPAPVIASTKRTPESPPISTPEFVGQVAADDGWTHSVNDVVQPPSNQKSNDLVGDAFAASLKDGDVASVKSVASEPTKEAGSAIITGGYRLSPEARAAIVGATASIAAGEAVQAPVNCRVSVVHLHALLSVFRSNSAVLSAFERVQCDVMFPGPVAQLIANELAGVMVDMREVPAVLQKELSRLR